MWFPNLIRWNFQKAWKNCEVEVLNNVEVFNDVDVSNEVVFSSSGSGSEGLFLVNLVLGSTGVIVSSPSRGCRLGLESLTFAVMGELVRYSSTALLNSVSSTLALMVVHRR